MKNILLPTDFSENSLNAIHYALHFFEDVNCTFHVLNVQKSSQYISSDLISATQKDSIYKSIASDNKKDLDQLVKKLAKQYKSQNFTFNGIFDFDDIVSSVMQVVKFHEIEMIIMGTNGATGASETILGSNTLRIVRHVYCPTLVIPENYKFHPIHRVLLTIQDTKDYGAQGIAIFRELLEIHPSQLNIIEIDEQAKSNPHTKKASSFNNLLKRDYNHYILKNIPSLEAINTATQLLKIDLNCIAIEKESFLKRLLFGSTTQGAVNNALIPILFLHR